jgi:O-antigen/teichoic acid export membrane protein
VLNVLLIPSYGMVGASIATIAAELTVAAIVSWQARSLVSWRTPLSIETILPAAALVAVTLALSSFPLFIPVIVGAAMYLALSIGLMALTNSRPFHIGGSRLPRED